MPVVPIAGPTRRIPVRAAATRDVVPEHPYVPTQEYRDRAFDLVLGELPDGIHLVGASVVDRLRYAAVERERLVGLALNAVARVRLGETSAAIYAWRKPRLEAVDPNAAQTLEETRLNLVAQERWVGENATASSFAELIHGAMTALATDTAVRARFALPPTERQPTVTTSAARTALREAMRRRGRGLGASAVQTHFAPADVIFAPRRTPVVDAQLLDRVERFAEAEGDIIDYSAEIDTDSGPRLARLHGIKMDERSAFARIAAHHADVAFLGDTLERATVLRGPVARPSVVVSGAVRMLEQRLAAAVALHGAALRAAACDRVRDVAADRL